jgi:nonsense-mediated mRNA decay protein 3
MRIKTSNKLVSTDVKSNTANVKYTVACDMVPLCRDDLVLVHKAAKGTHLTGRLCLVTKVSSVVHLVDAFPKRIMTGEGIVGELCPETYYKSGADKHYKVWSSSRRMTKFVVLDIEMCDSAGGLEPNHMVKYALADVQLARESDFGVNDETFHCVTHLGNLLQVGDTVLGYDMSSAVMSGGAEWNVDTCFNHSFVMPDVVLVKKVQGVEKEQQFENKIEKVKLGRAKKRERRRNREEKKMRELEEAAERMGFLEHINEEQFEHQLASDPDLAEDLLAAERELANIAYYSPDEEVIPQDVPGVPDQELVPENVSDKPEDEQGNDQDTSAGI